MRSGIVAALRVHARCIRRATRKGVSVKLKKIIQFAELVWILRVLRAFRNQRLHGVDVPAFGLGFLVDLGHVRIERVDFFAQALNTLDDHPTRGGLRYGVP